MPINSEIDISLRLLRFSASKGKTLPINRRKHRILPINPLCDNSAHIDSEPISVVTNALTSGSGRFARQRKRYETMSKEAAQEDGRMIVASAKIPASMGARIDAKARKKLQTRAGWLKDAILEKLARDDAGLTPVLS